MSAKKMNTHVVLVRGINVGGKNKVPMAGLKECLEQLGLSTMFSITGQPPPNLGLQPTVYTRREQRYLTGVSRQPVGVP